MDHNDLEAVKTRKEFCFFFLFFVKPQLPGAVETPSGFFSLSVHQRNSFLVIHRRENFFAGVFCEKSALGFFCGKKNSRETKKFV